MANVSFYYGTKANYNSLQTKNADTLYFITDTLQLYKGVDEYTKQMEFVSQLPSEARQGILYILASDFSAYRYTGSAYQKLFLGYVQAIPEITSHDNVPTTKAVADYVNAKIAEITGTADGYVENVTYSNGALTVIKGGTGTTTTLGGVAHDVSYNNQTQTLTIPMFGSQSALEINFSQLSVVSGGQYNAETQKIELNLANGQTVEIPVGALIDVYTGIGTTTTTTTVNQSNQISVAVKVSATANNAITIEEDGLYVPLPDAYTKAQMDSIVQTINGTINSHIDNTDIHVTTTEKATWDAKVSSAQLTAATTSAIQTAAADATEKANQALTDAKAYADGLNNTTINRLSVVERAVIWNTIQPE